MSASALRRRARTLWLAAAAATPIALSLPASAADSTLILAGDGMPADVVLPLVRSFRTQYPQVALDFVPVLDARGSVRALADGRIDVAIAEMEPTAPKPPAGIEAIEWLRTPIVLAADPASAPDSVSSGEVVAIYSGWADRWSNGAMVRIVLQPHDHPGMHALRRLSHGMATAVDTAVARPGMTIAYAASEAAALLADLPGAVGSTTLAHVLASHGRIKPVRLDGREPNPETLAGADEPLASSIVLLTSQRSSLAARRLVAFLHDPRWHTTLRAAGYLPVATADRY